MLQVEHVLAPQKLPIKRVQDGLGHRRHVGCKLGKRRAVVNREVDVVDAIQPNQSRSGRARCFAASFIDKLPLLISDPVVGLLADPASWASSISPKRAELAASKP